MAMKVAVLGANGTLGPPVIGNLTKRGFIVTLVTRNAAKTAEKYANCEKVLEADYSSVDSLAELVRGQDAVVILVSREEADAQIMAIDAAIKAGVRRVIPSCFGVGTRDEYLRTLPFLAAKIKMEDYIVDRAQAGQVVFTGIQTGIFLDWALPLNILLDCTGQGPSIVFDNGDVALSASLLDDIGNAVAAALEAPEWDVGNRFVNMQSTSFTQNQLLAIAKELKPDAPWKTMRVDTAETEKKAWEAWNSGDRSRETARGFMARSMHGLGYGHFKQLDNELLGIKDGGEETLRATLARFIH